MLVQIFVPTTEPGNKGSIGTGYSIAANRILTARHVLYPENRDESREIEIRWYDRDGDLRQWKNPIRILWPGDTRFDVAILECDPPIGTFIYPKLQPAQTSNNAAWTSKGFAEAGRKDDGRWPYSGMDGKISLPGSNQTDMELTVDAPPASAEGWKGASGSPVFIGDAIYGVIVEAPKDFEGRRLRAIPMWKLLNDETFKSIVDTHRTPPTSAIIKRKPIFLASLVNTNWYFKQIVPARPHQSQPDLPPSQCLFYSDFSDECPDSLKYKLIHKLFAYMEEPLELIFPDNTPTLDSAETLLSSMLAPYHQLLEPNSPRLFFHNLMPQHAGNLTFIKQMLEAWSTLTAKNKRVGDFLILLHEVVEAPGWLNQFRLRFWRRRLQSRLASGPKHCTVMKRMASPSVSRQGIAEWLKTEMKPYCLVPSVSDEFSDAVEKPFVGKDKRQLYKAIRLDLISAIENHLKNAEGIQHDQT